MTAPRQAWFAGASPAIAEAFARRSYRVRRVVRCRPDRALGSGVLVLVEHDGPHPREEEYPCGMFKGPEDY